MLSPMKIYACLYSMLVASAAAYTNSPLFQKPGYGITVPKSGQPVSKYGGSSSSLNMMDAVNAVLPSAIFLGGMAASIALEPTDSTAAPKWVTNPWIPPQMPESLGGKKKEGTKKEEDSPAVASAEDTAVASTTTEETTPTKVDEPKKSSNIIIKTLSLLWRIFQKIIAPWRKWESIA